MYTVKRAADRRRMADELESIIREAGASVTRKEGAPGSFFPGPREIHLDVKAARGLHVLIELDGDSSQPDTHVLAWNVDLDSDACLSWRFAHAVGATWTGALHPTKATAVNYGWRQMCDAVKRGLEMAADGSAFDPEREAREIERNGTAADRNLIFLAWQQDEAGETPDPETAAAQADALERRACRWERDGSRPDMVTLLQKAAAARRAMAGRRAP